MSKHTCTTLVLHCLDWRLRDGDLHRALIEAQVVPPQFDPVSLAGAVKSLTMPAGDHEQAFVLKQIELSRKLHEIERVVLVNHQDCGAYGGTAAFVDHTAELEAHRAELTRSAAIIGERFPELSVSGYFAKLQKPSDRWVIELEHLL